MVAAASSECPDGNYTDLVIDETMLCIMLNLEVGDCWNLASPPEKVSCSGAFGEVVAINAIATGCPEDTDFHYMYTLEDKLICARSVTGY